MQIPFFPLVKKDLTFIHFGNDSRVDGLVNFEKLRMISKEVRQVTALARIDSTSPAKSLMVSKNYLCGCNLSCILTFT